MTDYQPVEQIQQIKEDDNVRRLDTACTAALALHAPEEMTDVCLGRRTFDELHAGRADLVDYDKHSIAIERGRLSLAGRDTDIVVQMDTKSRAVMLRIYPAVVKEELRVKAEKLSSIKKPPCGD
jgi:hypothetical protein